MATFGKLVRCRAPWLAVLVLALVGGVVQGGPASAASAASVSDRPASAASGSDASARATGPSAERKAKHKKKHKHKHKKHRKHKKHAKKKKVTSVRATGGLTVKLAEFNVLGSQHTAPGGGTTGYAPGTTRAMWTASLLRARASEVVGFSEVQPDQLAILQAQMPTFAFYPGTTLGYKGVPTNIAYDTTKYSLVRAYTRAITFVGQTRLVPYVELQSLATGRHFWVFNAHNSPKRTTNSFAAERASQVAAEVATIKVLQATGLPVFFMGDLNDHKSTYCQVTAARMFTPLFDPATAPASTTTCTPPPGSNIDWIFGTTKTYEDLLVDKSPAVALASDHPLLTVTAIVP